VDVFQKMGQVWFLHEWHLQNIQYGAARRTAVAIAHVLARRPLATAFGGSLRSGHTFGFGFAECSLRVFDSTVHLAARCRSADMHLCRGGVLAALDARFFGVASLKCVDSDRLSHLRLAA